MVIDAAHPALKEGKPWRVTGKPRAARITTPQTSALDFDFDMHPARAAAAPRIHHQWRPDE